MAVAATTKSSKNARRDILAAQDWISPIPDKAIAADKRASPKKRTDKCKANFEHMEGAVRVDVKTQVSMGLTLALLIHGGSPLDRQSHVLSRVKNGPETDSIDFTLQMSPLAAVSTVARKIS